MRHNTTPPRMVKLRVFVVRKITKANPEIPKFYYHDFVVLRIGRGKSG
jgi:hypothetical protein